MIEQGEILTLDDDKEYVVVASTVYEEINYVYLMDPKDYGNFMFCAYDQTDGLYEVEDSELLDKLLHIFNEQLNSHQED